MRRHVLAAFVVTLVALTASAVSSAQSQDAIVSSARAMAQQGNHESAIAMLRGALVTRPSDTAIRGALVEMLEARRARLQAQIDEAGREIAALRGAAAAGDGCDGRAPIEVGKTIKPPMKLHDVKPAYPKEALDAGIGGTVVMRLMIGCSGEVLDAEVVNGVPQLNEAALSAVKQWRYRPTLMNGTPVPVMLHATMTFTPNG